MQRIVLKLSGEMLGTRGIDAKKTRALVAELAEVAQTTQLAVVLGGGNIWRGRDSAAFEFTGADSDAIGMLATLMNGRTVTTALQQLGVDAECFAPHGLPRVADTYTPQAAKAVLDRGGIAVLAGGTGAPFFTTDTATVLRGLEVGASAVLKGTKVDGVYDSDPTDNPAAIKFDQLSYAEAIERGLRVMDTTAFALAQENQLPIYVFNASDRGSLVAAAKGQAGGSWVR